MGYVHDTHFAQFNSPNDIVKSAGTWTPTLASNTLGDVRTAGNATFNLFVPIIIPSNSSALKGCKLESVELLYTIATELFDDFATVELEKMSISSAGVVTGAAVTQTQDTGHDSAAERKATGDHRMKVTITTPAWIDNDEHYVLYCALDAGANGVFTLWGAIANFTLRA